MVLRTYGRPGRCDPLPFPHQEAANIPKLQQIRNWSPTPEVFQQFLSWLDEGQDSGGRRYLEMRRRLVSYFDRKNCDNADDLADETLNRVMRRLDEEGCLTDSPPARYCYIVAKFVFLEELRRPRNSDADIERLERMPHLADCQAPGSMSETAQRENLLRCLDNCLLELDESDRELILEYYQGEQRAKIEARRSIALKMGLTMNAVSIRACRIRNKLESCMRNCSRNS